MAPLRAQRARYGSLGRAMAFAIRPAFYYDAVLQAHSQKRQIHCRFQGAEPLGGIWGGAPKELCVHRAPMVQRFPKINLMTNQKMAHQSSLKDLSKHHF